MGIHDRCPMGIIMDILKKSNRRNSLPAPHFFPSDFDIPVLKQYRNRQMGFSELISQNNEMNSSLQKTVIQPQTEIMRTPLLHYSRCFGIRTWSSKGQRVIYVWSRCSWAKTVCVMTSFKGSAAPTQPRVENDMGGGVIPWNKFISDVSFHPNLYLIESHRIINTLFLYCQAVSLIQIYACVYNTGGPRLSNNLLFRTMLKIPFFADNAKIVFIQLRPLSRTPRHVPA